MFDVFRKFFQVRVFEHSAVMRYSKVAYRFLSKFRKMHVVSDRGHEGVKVDTWKCSHSMLPRILCSWHAFTLGPHIVNEYGNCRINMEIARMMEFLAF